MLSPLELNADNGYMFSYYCHVPPLMSYRILFDGDWFKLSSLSVKGY